MGEMIKKIRGNFGRYSLYLVLQIVIIVSQYTIFNEGASDIIAQKSLRAVGRLSFGGSIVLLFVTPLLSGYLATINKNVLLGKRDGLIKELIEGMSYYFRVLGGTLLVYLMIFGVVLLMYLLIHIPLLGILGVIGAVVFLIYLSVKYSTIAEAIVYKDCGVSDGMDTCKEVANDYFWELFVLAIPVGILNIISGVVGGTVAIAVISITTILYSIFASYYKVTLIAPAFAGEYKEDTEEKDDNYPGI